MFWGLVLEPNKRYSQTVEKPFHVSMASLNLTKSDDSVVQVMLNYGNTSFLLCNLQKSTTLQVPLDLNFQEGSSIAFICHGHGQVHLTGYLIPEDLDIDESEAEEEEEVEEEEESSQLINKQSKRKTIKDSKSEKNVKRLKHEIETESSEEDIELDDVNEDESDDEEEEEKDVSLMSEAEDSEEQEEEERKQKDEKNKHQQKKKDKKKLLNGKEMKKNKNNGVQLQKEQNIPKSQLRKVVPGGVITEDLKLGDGPLVKNGKSVSVYYVGRLKNGKKFDAKTNGDGFMFKLGNGEVIKGLDIGILGMKVGGERRITVPPAMAYGARGSPPAIPPNSTLAFNIKLLSMH